MAMDEPRMTGLRNLFSRGVGVACLAAGLAAACSGTLGMPDTHGSADDTVSPNDPNNPWAQMTRFRRLTHVEWSNTVRDLLGVDAEELTSSFRSDPRASGFLFDNNALALGVDQALASAYQRVAGQIAEQVVGDPEKLAELVPSGSDNEEERVRAFIEDFGKRVHRRPLTDEQIDQYYALYEVGLTAYEDTPGFAGGIRLVLEGLLQSPYFLYRVEISDKEQNGVVALDGWERAQRLSYFLWATMPDDELFEAAEKGELDTKEGVVAQAQRLLDDPRAAAVLERFSSQVFDVGRYERIAPSPDFFPDVASTLGASAAEETRRFVRHILYENQGGVVDLFTSTTSFVNRDLAAVYGLDGSFGSDFEQVELNGEERAGILTQVGFLASHATSVKPDPIHRGVFVAKRLNCLSIAAPPDAVPPLPEPGDKTNREAVEDHTEAEGTSCRACHGTVINPFGFPFESYDAVGAFQTEDNGKPVDTSATPVVGGEPIPVADARELSAAMANSLQVHECFAKHLVEFAFGRPAVGGDDPVIAELGQESHQGADFKAIMIRLVSADSFLNRAPEEMP